MKKSNDNKTSHLLNLCQGWWDLVNTLLYSQMLYLLPSYKTVPATYCACLEYSAHAQDLVRPCLPVFHINP